VSSPSLKPVIHGIGRVLLGKERQVRLALACLLARGHLLIEDLPGVGKTTLAEALARSFGLNFKRVSFTSDLLPADLTGLNVFDQANLQFHFQPSPLFSQMLLADEINRASPRTQSALDQGGTSPLPESQLDRFLMRLSLGFPGRQAERALLRAVAEPYQLWRYGKGARPAREALLLSASLRRHRRELERALRRQPQRRPTC